MKKIKKEIKIFLTCILALFPTLTFAQSDLAPLEKTAKQIVSINKKIERQTDRESYDKLIRSREDLLRIASIMLRNIEMKVYRKPTLDVSSRYDFALQKYKLSCEIAALRMILNSFVPTPFTEEYILNALPIYSKPLSWDGIWGDPDREFVGYYTGSQRAQTGYGVHEAPLARFLQYENIESRITNRFDKTGDSPRKRMQDALTTISNSGHVILWGDWCTTPKYDDGLVESIDTFLVKRLGISGLNSCDRPPEMRKMKWKTPEGKTIQAISGEHAFILLGYIGTIDRPTHIIVFDTDTGKHIYPYTEWMRKWALLDYRALHITESSIDENKLKILQ